MRFKNQIRLQRFLKHSKYFHDVSNANVIKSNVDRSSKDFQVLFYKYYLETLDYTIRIGSY